MQMYKKRAVRDKKGRIIHEVRFLLFWTVCLLIVASVRRTLELIVVSF